jgi:3-deoxy-D-manno-octulosonic-acid transferase
MQRWWRLLYSVVIIPLLWVLLHLVGFFNRKVRWGIAGRRRLFQDLRRQLAALPAGKRVWFHSSSLGEFEQAKPIIAELKSRHKDVIVIVSFFSPSGYEHSRKYQLADAICYLPFDTRRNAKRFIDLVQPDVAVMVRYDVWPNHIWELRERSIPVLIANATMREHSKRHVPLVRNFHLHVYDAISGILTVSENDLRAFKRFAVRRPVLEAIGDTRYDQVSKRSEEARKRHIIPPGVIGGKKVFVVGSSWPEDEEHVVPAFLQLLEERPGRDVLMIIAPHEPTVEHIEELERSLEGRASFIRFSALNEYTNENIVIVDSVGILLILYCHAQIAYVGGSFRQGVHNVLEAAVYGIPVLFGPRHRNSQEPLMLVGRGGGFVVNNSAELHRALSNLLSDESARRSAGLRAAEFVRANVGATDRFLSHLEPFIMNNRTDG